MPKLRSLITTLAVAAGLAGALAQPALAAHRGQPWVLVSFVDAIHETHVGATLDTHWSVPVSTKTADPCSFRSEIVGRQETEFRAPGQYVHGARRTVVAIGPNGRISPSTIDVPAQVERHVTTVSHLEDLAPECGQQRWAAPGLHDTQRIEMPGCGVIPGTMHLHLQLVDGNRALRISGEFQPTTSTLDDLFGPCSMAMLPNSFDVEKQGGIIRHDYGIDHRFTDARFIEASGVAHNRASDFLRPGSRASSVLALTAQMRRR